MPRARIDPETRFWRHVERSGADECWRWTGCTIRTGYGRFQEGSRSAPKVTPAHRFAYETAHGPIPAGLVVKHACDNRACVNPAHLTAGTQAENLAEMVARGRARKARGERAGKAKLTVDQVREIRRLDAARPRQHPTIARQFGVSISAVWAIVHRKHWAHVPD